MRIKKCLIFLIVILSFTFFAETAHAARGRVVYKSNRCDYFIVETLAGYTVLEWYGGNVPDKGDIIVGNFESYGFKDIYNVTAESDLRVWVEEYWLSKDRALEKYFQHCK